MKGWLGMCNETLIRSVSPYEDPRCEVADRFSGYRWPRSKIFLMAAKMFLAS
jgi:hypothetical protein